MSSRAAKTCDPTDAGIILKYSPGDPGRMYLRYVGIRVRDLERSVKFYSELFGLKEERRGDMTRYGLGI